MLPSHRLIFLILLALWAGLLLGVSFLATPVKFSAEHLTMPVALEIGVATFGVFNVVEWSVMALVLAVAFIRRTPHLLWISFVLLAILSVETFWLLPVLDTRAAAVIAGAMASPGIHHWMYIVAESVKLLVFVMGIWLIGWRRA
jgi:hypothetical protein